MYDNDIYDNNFYMLFILPIVSEVYVTMTRTHQTHSLSFQVPIFTGIYFGLKYELSMSSEKREPLGC